MPATVLNATPAGGSAGVVAIGAGTVEVACDNVNGNGVRNGGYKMLLLFRNSTGGALNVTFNTPLTVDGNAVADPVVSVPANGQRVCGPFDPSVYGDPVLFTAAAATVFVTAVQLP